jgi:spoIIIJ-associated protein
MASGNGERGGEGGESIEVSGKTVDDAVAQALARLGRGRDEVTVEVLHPGSPGRLLGFGAEPARVRVTPAGSAATTTASSDGPDAAVATPTEAPRTSTTTRGPADDEAVATLEAAPEDHRDGPPEDEAALASDAELARLMLAELLNRMDMGGSRIDVRAAEPISLEIRGHDVADLIGRRGENLRALQFVLNLMVNKQLRRHRRVVVDVDGYRARREELLRGMAERFAHRVRTTGEPLQLEAMPPNERRIVHLALADDPDVVTESTGEGDARRVVIKPHR